MKIDDTMKQSLADKHSWTRGLFMLLFLVIFALVELVLWGVVLFQFGHLIFTGRINQRLIDFGDDLRIYAGDAIAYLTFNTDTRPFPFDEWPEAEEGLGDDAAVTEDVEVEDLEGELRSAIDDDPDRQPV
ncbi:MAG: DUF4389 domain-containing protein [Pseudomonadota bacterium]